MKILLVSPIANGLRDKIAYPPIGLMYLASNCDYDCEILNMITGNEQFEYKYDIYGISIHSPAVYSEAKRIIYNIRLHQPEALIVCGGAFATSMADYVLKETETNIIVIGEGELALNNIVKREYSCKCKLKLKYELIPQLDMIKFPARYLLSDEQIRYEGTTHHTDEPATTIFATRGCPYNCNFCDTELWCRRWRSRSQRNIMEEILQIKQSYGIDWFRFPDDCLTINQEWFTNFCNIIKQLGIDWTMLARSNTVNSEILDLAKSAGCREVFFGIESGSYYMLKLMNKNTTIEQNKKAIELCKQVGLKCCAYIMFGFPGENNNTVRDTIEFLEETKPDKSRIHQFLPVPGSDVYKNPEKYQIELKYNWDDYYDFLDNPNLTLKYLYISDEKFFELREQIKKFYTDMGYFENLYKKENI